MGLTGLATGALLLPSFPGFGGTLVDPARLLEPGLDVAVKKRLADAALNAAKAAGATYADVRIGRYLNQSIFTREKQVQNIASGESFGGGRAGDCQRHLGLCRHQHRDRSRPRQSRPAGRADCQSQRQSAEGKGAAGPAEGLRRGNAGKRPFRQNAFEVPVKDKVDLLLAANATALDNGASFVNSAAVSGE